MATAGEQKEEEGEEVLLGKPEIHVRLLLTHMWNRICIDTAYPMRGCCVN